MKGHAHESAFVEHLLSEITCDCPKSLVTTKFAKDK